MQNQTQNSNTKGLMVILAIIAGVTLTPAFFMIVLRFFTAKGMRFPFMGHEMPFHFMFGIIPMLLLGLWIAMTVWVYRDAESRRMNGALWAILTFFGNIIGLIIYLIIRSQDLSPVRGIEMGTTACPSCSGAVAQGFTFCPHCGHQMEASCQSCGKPVQPNWHNCPYCGAELKQF